MAGLLLLLGSKHEQTTNNTDMNINTLTIKAQEALQAALTLARERGQQAGEPLHLLSVLIRDDDSLSTFLLGRVSVNVRGLRDEVQRAVGQLPRVEGGNGEQFFAQESSRLIQHAVDFTKTFGDKYASVEHLLLALVAERGQAADLLHRPGAPEKRGNPMFIWDKKQPPAEGTTPGDTGAGARGVGP